MSKGTKKIGRTLTTLADTPDKRAQDLVVNVVSPKAKRGRRKKGKVKHVQSAIGNESLGLDLGKSLEFYYFFVRRFSQLIDFIVKLI